MKELGRDPLTFQKGLQAKEEESMQSPEKEWAEGRSEVSRMPCHKNRRHFKKKRS